MLQSTTQTITPDKIINRKEHRGLYSNLVYPTKFKQIVQIDDDFVKSTLKRNFNCDSIHNKYVVNVNNHLWYQHDSKTWLITFD